MTRSGNKDRELSETDGIGRTISSRESQKVHIGAYCGPDITYIIDSETPANDRYAQKTEKGCKDTKCVRMDRRLNDNRRISFDKWLSQS